MVSVVKKCKYGCLDQGMIFTCARAANYPQCQVHGVIITARCDIAHSKVPILNYLPIVRLEDWLRRDFISVASGRARKEVEGKFGSLLKNNSFNPSVLLTEPPRVILDTLFPSENKALNKARQAVETCVSELEFLEEIESAAPGGILLKELYNRFPKVASGIVRECVQYRLNSYYFLSSIDPQDEERAGYVVLLREVQTLTPALSHAVVCGLDSVKYERICSTDPLSAGKLDFTVDDFAMPISQIQSPNIEHLMQSFAMLFLRIGIEDMNRDYIEHVTQRGFGG
jgi:hypothetical protein